MSAANKEEVIKVLKESGLSDEEIKALGWSEMLKKHKEIMSKTKSNETEEKKAVVKEDLRIDEVSTDYLIRMGCENPNKEGEVLPEVAKLFKKFKTKMDMVSPGRLSPEGYAFIVLLFDLQKKGK